MQVFDTTRGVGRRNDDHLELLDTAGMSLYDLVVDELLNTLATATVTGRLLLADASFRSPVRPARLFQVGLNYHSHLDEIGIDAPQTPPFGKSETGASLSEPGATILLPFDAPTQVDHECEIAVVIGAPARNVLAVNAWSVIAGLTSCNDVSARDIQRAGLAKGEMTAGKLLPGFKPFGPGLIVGDEAQQTLTLSLAVNGETRQSSDTADMVFSICQIIELLSAQETLVPGDVIITGSPAGVGIFSGKFLSDGDVVDIFLGQLPALRNTFSKG
jgi:2-keto-4-pentenoate hydratase/2-oxohepta-3-ene-1,7-dioic acid hydratase in catechol pathway